MSSLQIRTFVGAGIAPHLVDLARLRNVVFRDWPYLHAANSGNEIDYLKMYTRSWRSVLVLVLHADEVVGAATGLPLGDAETAIRAPFAPAGLDVERIFYCGESMLLPAYRGQGLGHRFFAEREAHARRLGGFERTAFCSVARASDDARRPPFGRDHEAFWRKRGYQPRAGLQVAMSWHEIERGRQPHALDVWMRPLERSP